MSRLTPRSMLLARCLPAMFLWSCTSPSPVDEGNDYFDVSSALDAGDEGDTYDGGFTPVPCRSRGEPLLHQEVAKSGVLLRVLEVEPKVPVVGDNSWLVELTQLGDPVIGMASRIVVSPRMPDHGHGSPVQVGVSEEGDGQYRLSPVNMFMPGYWEIGVMLPDVSVITADASAAQRDVSLTLRVCIE